MLRFSLPALVLKVNTFSFPFLDARELSLDASRVPSFKWTQKEVETLKAAEGQGGTTAEDTAATSLISLMTP